MVLPALDEASMDFMLTRESRRSEIHGSLEVGVLVPALRPVASENLLVAREKREKAEEKRTSPEFSNHPLFLSSWPGGASPDSHGREETLCSQ